MIPKWVSPCIPILKMESTVFNLSIQLTIFQLSHLKRVSFTLGTITDKEELCRTITLELELNTLCQRGIGLNVANLV